MNMSKNYVDAKSNVIDILFRLVVKTDDDYFVDLYQVARYISNFSF